MTALAPARPARLDGPVLGRRRATHGYWAVLAAIFVCSSWLSGQLYLVTVVAVVVTRLGRPGRKMLIREKESEVDGPHA